MPQLRKDIPYYDYHHYLREKFGSVTYKVSVDGGFTCPNMDGLVATGGCSYCNNRSFIPPYLKRDASIRQQLDQGVASQRKRYGASCFLAYFQAYSNTYDTVERLKKRYMQALSHPDIDGLVIGTRADCLPGPVLDLLSSIAEESYVCLEIGVESVFDDTLRKINRGHDFACVQRALRELESRNIPAGGHMILGFPWESRSQWVQSASIISGLPLQYVKLHHLQVVRGTALARQYLQNPFPVTGYEDWVQGVCDFLEWLRPGMALARLSGSTPSHLLIAPRWGKKKHPEVKQAVIQELRRRNHVQGQFYKSS